MKNALWLKTVALLLAMLCCLLAVACNGTGQDPAESTSAEEQPSEEQSTEEEPTTAESTTGEESTTEPIGDSTTTEIVDLPPEPPTIEINQDLVAKTEGQVIDLYLIAGQSNAAGYSHITEEFKASNPAFVKGYSNILFSGISALTSDNGVIAYVPRIMTLQKTIAGLGRSESYSGPELGMAEALSSHYNAESGKMAGFIKFAAGATSLRDITSGNYEAAGNWAPPSYIESKGGPVGDKSGGLYRLFLQQVKTSIAEYEAHGYTVEIKGVYWMQGEADRLAPDLYAEIFRYLVSDMRKDLGEIAGKDLSTLPIIMGGVSNAYHLAHEEETLAFVNAQREMVQDMENVYLNDSIPFGVGTDNSDDTQHWTSDDMLFIGEMVGTKFLSLCCNVSVDGLTLGEPVAEVYDADGQKIGAYASLAYAVNSAPVGATIKLVKDITLYGNLNLNNLNAVTVDGNGHIITSYSVTHGVRLVGCEVTLVNFVLDHKTEVAKAYGMYVYKTTKLTFKSGSITAQSFAIVVNQTSEVHIEGGSFQTRNAMDQTSSNCAVIYVSRGGGVSKSAPTVTISGGVFTAADGTAAITVNTKLAPNATVTITGGTLRVSAGTPATVCTEGNVITGIENATVETK